MHAMLVPNRDDRLESEHANFHLDGRPKGSQMAEVAFSFHLVSIPSRWKLNDPFLEMTSMVNLLSRTGAGQSITLA